MKLQPNLPKGGPPCDQETHAGSSIHQLQVANRNVRLSATCLVTTLHCIHILTRTRPITVSTLVVPIQLHLIYVVDLSLMIKQIAIISGLCLALSWVRTHKHVCEGTKTEPHYPNLRTPNFQAYVLRGKTTLLPPTVICIFSHY